MSEFMTRVRLRRLSRASSRKVRFCRYCAERKLGRNPLPRSLSATELAVSGYLLQSCHRRIVTPSCYPLGHLPGVAGGPPGARLAVGGARAGPAPPPPAGRRGGFSLFTCRPPKVKA